MNSLNHCKRDERSSRLQSHRAKKCYEPGSELTLGVWKTKIYSRESLVVIAMPSLNSSSDISFPSFDSRATT